MRMDAEQCEKKLYDAKVLIANGSSQALNQATAMLLPPSKECRDPAVDTGPGPHKGWKS